MKKFGFFILLILCSCSWAARASHIFGGDFFYTYLSGNTYKITLVLYGDCAGTPAFNGLPDSQPLIEIFKGSTFQDSLRLVNTGPYTGQEVSAVCPAELSNTTCNGGTLPGVKKFTYTGTVTLPTTATNWKFVFTGNVGSGSSAGRSNSITNILIGGGSIFSLVAELNNTGGPNSSPTFTTIPTPFYCINSPQDYNQGAVDPDGDVLIYSLAPALEPSGATVSYVSGYTAANPLSVAAGTFSFSSSTGQLSFTPDNVQKSVVVNKVVEKRSGVQVGTAMREMTFIVVDICSNQAPTISLSDITSITGAFVDTTTNTFYVCPGTALVDILFPVAMDPDGNNITITPSGLPAGMTVNVSDNGGTAPQVHLNWNTSSVAAGDYTFFLNFADDGCPLASHQSLAYTVSIGNPLSVIPGELIPTQCYHPALWQYNISGGAPDYQVIINASGSLFHSFTTSSSSPTDSLPPGNYSISVMEATGGCPTLFSDFTVVDSGVFPFAPVIITPTMYCTGDPALQLEADTFAGAVVHWFDGNGDTLSGAPTPNTSVPGVTYFSVSQTYNVCTSESDTIPVYVTDQPTAAFTVTPHDPCSRLDTVLVQFTGAVGSGPFYNYSWDWSGGHDIPLSPQGPWSVSWDTAGDKTITLTVTENGCSSNPVTDFISVKPTPLADFTVVNACLNQPAVITYSGLPLSGQTWLWQFQNDSMPVSNSQGPFLLTYDTEGTKTISLTVAVDGCADSSSQTITVYPAPSLQLPTAGGTACYGDKIILIQNAGTTTYTWTPDDHVFHEPDGTVYVRILEPITYSVIAENEFGCTLTDSFTFTNVEPCCTFSYPDAFTPNQDGHNDKFRVILYGNEEWFTLEIYNRWGQRIFLTRDPKAGWDGTFNGVPCEQGVYFYHSKGRCLTGHEEEKSGELTLIR